MPTSEKVAHTPGPWELEQRRDNTVRIVDEQEVTVAVCYQQPMDTWTVEANAHLIAAAPDLLAALQRFSDCREAHDTGGVCYEDHDDMIHVADAAIAKARGS